MTGEGAMANESTRTTRHAADGGRDRSAIDETGSRALAIQDVMTAQPLTIGREQSLSIAHEMMRKHSCHHLPVLERGELVGVVTQRDLYLLETIAGVDLRKDKVDDAMSNDAYAVAPETPLDEVTAEMAERKYGCAVVIERGRVVGIFTTTDALRVLAGLVP
jgi:acetoin utilization protein AcuB